MPGITLSDGRQLTDCLPEFAEDIVNSIFAQDPEHSQELLGAFVSQLFICATKQSMRRERKAKQAEGIAAAKARGVKFGVERKPLPDNFDEVRIAWRNHEMNLKEAAKLCEMAPTTFYDNVRRAEEQELETALDPVNCKIPSARKKFLPDNFEEARRAWRSHEMKMEDAARMCGMATSSFYTAVRRVEQRILEKQEQEASQTREGPLC